MILLDFCHELAFQNLQERQKLESISFLQEDSNNIFLMLNQ